MAIRRYREDMIGRNWRWAAAAGLLAGSTGPAYACECVGYDTDAEMVAREIKALSHASVGLDGVVTRSTDAFGANSTAIIRPTRIWFGDKRREYRVKYRNNCDTHYRKGRSERLTLYRSPPDASLLGRLAAVLRGNEPLYEAAICSDFSAAMRYPAMREAVRDRSQQR